MMKKLLTAIALLVLGVQSGFTQNIIAADTLQHVVVYYNIFDDLKKDGKDGAHASIIQPAYVKQAVQLQISKNENGFSMDGYRIRVFSDNKQNSRQVSESMVQDLALKYPGMKAYRSYSSPYFRVSVGDFRTLNEARAFLEAIKQEYPKAYPVKEKISFPPL